MFVLMPIQNSLKTVNLNILYYRIFNKFKSYYVPILPKKITYLIQIILHLLYYILLSSIGMFLFILVLVFQLTQ